MSGKQWMKNRLPFLLTNLLCMAALSAFLLLGGNTPDTVVFILMIWTLILCIGLSFSFLSAKRRYDRLLRMAEGLEERYLIPEVMEEPTRAEDRVYWQILKMAERSMLEQAEQGRRERKEYREYIEQWIHEVKTPITAVRLLCDNNRSDLTREIMGEVEKITQYTEQSLYYARSENTQNDYLIREIRLSDVIHGAVADNKYLLMQNQVALELPEGDLCVCSDEKWLRFILDQLIVNAVKYRSKKPVIRFLTEDSGEYVTLSVQDNGIGIDAADLPRVFEKGFTGQNGRSVLHSTGLGLYLCRKLCDKLGIGIRIESPGVESSSVEPPDIEQAEIGSEVIEPAGTEPAKGAEGGTTVVLIFYLNHLIHQVQD